MHNTGNPDAVTRAACRWLLTGAEPGGYNGPDPPPGHDLLSLLSFERGDRDARLAASAGWLRIHQMLKPVLARLEHDVWALKGFDLARSIYPFPGGRPMTDADLLVKPENLGSTIRTFRELGWKVTHPGDGIMHSGIVSEVKAVRNGVMTELHTHIFYFPATFPGRLPPDLTSDCRELEPGLMGLAWHNALLSVILHMSTNTSIRPVWWADVCLLAGKVDERGTWREFTENVLRTRLSGPAGAILRTAAALGAPVPERVASLLGTGDERAEAVLDAIRARRTVPTLLNLKHLAGWKRIAWSWAMFWLVLARQSPQRGTG